MRCPFCEAQETKVVDSRLAVEGDQVRRRRECLNCSERFTTFETAELVMPRVIKSTGDREEFNEEKLRNGIHRALEKRPVSTEDIEQAIHRILHRMRTQGEREVSTRDLGEWVMSELSNLDQVAYIRFASVYRSFEDVHAFREVIDSLEKGPTPEQRKYQMSLLPKESAGKKKP